MSLLADIFDILMSGGWVMLPLVLAAFLLYAQGFQLLIFANRCRLKGDPETDWTGWVMKPSLAPEGCTRDILEYTQQDRSSTEHISNRFNEVHLAIVRTIERRARFINSIVSVAPLMGLLGTVLGMLSTFFGIATSGGSETMSVVAGGIEVALITTATGLTVALPGLFLVTLILRRKHQIDAALARLESVVLTAHQIKG